MAAETDTYEWSRETLRVRVTPVRRGAGNRSWTDTAVGAVAYWVSDLLSGDEVIASRSGRTVADALDNLDCFLCEYPHCVALTNPEAYWVGHWLRHLQKAWAG